ncbi:MAG TPA: hypothetical protein VN811_05270 [Thermoanaerobaculia bacterium]|nr:hypothetical protein [Thermoanaerobaculia bacterium]
MTALGAPPYESPLPISDFIDFPAKEVIVERLLAVDESPRLVRLYETIGDRLAAKTYERSASAFILIEMLYDFEEVVGSDMSYLLPRSIFTLTGDRDLALSALGAFNEIKDAIVLQAPAAPPPPAPPPLPAAAPVVAPPRPTETDVMMHKLQLAQKALVDLGLATRVSIDLSMRRPSRERVNRTLQDITALRSAMRRFEELLSQAELQVLEAAGVLWEGTAEPRDSESREQ